MRWLPPRESHSLASLFNKRSSSIQPGGFCCLQEMNEKKNTLVLGASDNPSRYSNLAIRRLRANGHPVVAIGKRLAVVADVPISTEKSEFENIHTVTLYLNPDHQKEYYNYILSLKPSRIIFNPGAENNELSALVKRNNIESTEACTLVMLSTGQF